MKLMKKKNENWLNDQFTELGIKQSVLVIPEVHGKPYWGGGGG